MEGLKVDTSSIKGEMIKVYSRMVLFSIKSFIKHMDLDDVTHESEIVALSEEIAEKLYTQIFK